MKNITATPRTILAIVVLLLMNVDTQAQYATAISFSEEAFLVSLTKNVPANPESGAAIISYFEEGVARTQLGDKFGLVNEAGDEICKPVYDSVCMFRNGYAAINKGGKWTFVDKQGKPLTAFEYQEVAPFQNGLAAVQMNNKWGFISEQGTTIVPISYEAVRVDADGNAFGKNKQEDWKLLPTKSLVDGGSE